MSEEETIRQQLAEERSKCSELEQSVESLTTRTLVLHSALEEQQRLTSDLARDLLDLVTQVQNAKIKRRELTSSGRSVTTSNDLRASTGSPLVNRRDNIATPSLSDESSSYLYTAPPVTFASSSPIKATTSVSPAVKKSTKIVDLTAIADFVNFRPNYTRQMATEKLFNAPKDSFILRPSSKPNSYAITYVADTGGQIKNCLITFKNGRYALDSAHTTYSTIVQLLKGYHFLNDIPLYILKILENQANE